MVSTDVSFERVDNTSIKIKIASLIQERPTYMFPFNCVREHKMIRHFGFAFAICTLVLTGPRQYAMASKKSSEIRDELLTQLKAEPRS